VAGTTVDLSLYPIDTLKTRLQSPKGFRAAGGFNGIYAGVGSAALGAAPGAAFFFVSYEYIKRWMREVRVIHLGNDGTTGKWPEPLDHVVAASVGEVAACAVRVPTEVVKQRAQAFEYKSSLAALSAILGRRKAIGATGVIRELYRGAGITVMREVPFTMIQFPLWEFMKESQRRRSGTSTVTAAESAVFGSISGALAAAVTTPLDVIKTRKMLSEDKQSISSIASHIIRTSGVRGFFAGIGPRMMWISAGGAVFLGSYQWAHNGLGRV